MIGITGEYLYRVSEEAVRRPLYFVSDSSWRESEQRRGADHAVEAQVISNPEQTGLRSGVTTRRNMPE
jgi:hypothetical protein